MPKRKRDETDTHEETGARRPSQTAVEPRRSEAVLRNEHLDKGAILIEFAPHPEADDDVVKWWRGMEKYGFLVADDGCIIPHREYFGSNGKRPPARCLVTRFFYSRRTEKQEPNEDGWPCNQQYSHLCHVRRCCSPMCIHIEEQWKNLKRTYCGMSGKCDCGVTPHCTRRYHSDTWEWGFDYLGYDTPNLRDRIAALLPGVQFRILQRNHYVREDLKRSNRLLRMRRGKRAK